MSRRIWILFQATVDMAASWLQGKNVIVFYGSQTGTAEDFATRLAKDSVRYGMKKGMAADPEEFEMVGDNGVT